jgi:hypothetical protein
MSLYVFHMMQGSIVHYTGTDPKGQPNLAVVTAAATGIPSLPGDFWRRTLCMGNPSGVVIAAVSMYNPNTQKGQLVVRSLSELPRSPESSSPVAADTRALLKHLCMPASPSSLVKPKRLQLELLDNDGSSRTPPPATKENGSSSKIIPPALGKKTKKKKSKQREAAMKMAVEQVVKKIIPMTIEKKSKKMKLPSAVKKFIPMSVEKSKKTVPMTVEKSSPTEDDENSAVSMSSSETSSPKQTNSTVVPPSSTKTKKEKYKQREAALPMSVEKVVKKIIPMSTEKKSKKVMTSLSVKKVIHMSVEKSKKTVPMTVEKASPAEDDEKSAVYMSSSETSLPTQPTSTVVPPSSTKTKKERCKQREAALPMSVEKVVKKIIPMSTEEKSKKVMTPLSVKKVTPMSVEKSKKSVPVTVEKTSPVEDDEKSAVSMSFSETSLPTQPNSTVVPPSCTKTKKEKYKQREAALPMSVEKVVKKIIPMSTEKKSNKVTSLSVKKIIPMSTEKSKKSVPMTVEKTTPVEDDEKSAVSMSFSETSWPKQPNSTVVPPSSIKRQKIQASDDDYDDKSFSVASPKVDLAQVSPEQRRPEAVQPDQPPKRGAITNFLQPKRVLHEWSENEYQQQQKAEHSVDGGGMKSPSVPRKRRKGEEDSQQDATATPARLEERMEAVVSVEKKLELRKEKKLRKKVKLKMIMEQENASSRESKLLEDKVSKSDTSGPREPLADRGRPDDSLLPKLKRQKDAKASKKPTAPKLKELVTPSSQPEAQAKQKIVDDKSAAKLLQGKKRVRESKPEPITPPPKATGTKRQRAIGDKHSAGKYSWRLDLSLVTKMYLTDLPQFLIPQQLTLQAS